MKRLTATALLTAILLAACGGITEGTVYEKTYTPARDWTTTEPDYDTRCTTKTRMKTVNGKTRTETYQDCQRYQDGWEEVAHHEDECYRVAFREGDDTSSVCVTKEQYDAVEIGDPFEVPSEASARPVHDPNKGRQP